MTQPKPKFEVDPTGLAKILERRGKAFAVFELIQNAWDTDAKEVFAQLKPVESSPLARLTVEDDDPHGFKRLSDAFTLYAESDKKSDPRKRGWINIGEKLVLALCTHATVHTTSGTIEFEGNTRTEYPRRKRKFGTRIEATIKMTRAELDECCEQMHRLMPPEGTHTSFNGVEVPQREPLACFTAKLVTHVADEDGIMRRRVRETIVEVHKPREGETGMLYEMGIPVVETGDTWHVNVLQKVPLNTDRDNVPPSYLRALRALVANHMQEHLTPEVAAEPWVTEALEDDAIDPEAVERVIDERFGDKHFTFDPSDREANHRLVAEGYTPIYPGALSGRAWNAVKAAGASSPAGALRPTKHQRFGPDDDPMHEIPADKQTEAERTFVRFSTSAGLRLLGSYIDVRLVSDPKITKAACYGSRQMIVNKFRLGSHWFEDQDIEQWLDLIIHELAHEYEANHLSHDYHDACTRLGARAFMWGRELGREGKELP